MTDPFLEDEDDDIQVKAEQKKLSSIRISHMKKIYA